MKYTCSEIKLLIKTNQQLNQQIKTDQLIFIKL